MDEVRDSREQTPLHGRRDRFIVKNADLRPFRKNYPARSRRANGGRRRQMRRRFLSAQSGNRRVEFSLFPTPLDDMFPLPNSR